MGTRGAWGFRKDNIDKIAYNHYDSYPSGLGETIKHFIVKHSIEELEKTFYRIILIDGNTPPNEEQIKQCSKFLDLGVSNKTKQDWYCLLREAQGNPEAYVNDLVYMVDSAAFLKDSLFCEWAYIINLDTKRLEIYEGCQKRAQKNRYYNCKLQFEVDLDKVKTFKIGAIK